METGAKSLAIIIVDAIHHEPFFNKDILIPKITSIIKGFRVKLLVKQYTTKTNIDNVDKLKIQNSIYYSEIGFLKSELKKLVTKDRLREIYLELDEKRKIWGDLDKKELIEAL